MKQYKIITLILMLLTSGNMLAEELDTLKVVDVEEILVIAAPKENRKLREQPTAVTLLSQQDMQAAQVNSIKNLTGLVPNMFIPRLRFTPDLRRLYPRHRLTHQHTLHRPVCGQYPLHRQVRFRLRLLRHRTH